MSDEQRAGLALVLMVVVLALWSKFYKPVVPSKPASVNSPAANVQQPPSVGPGLGNGQAQSAQASGTPAATTVPVKEAKAAQTITVESGLYRVELSNRGGVARSWTLEKYHDNEKPPKPLDLVNTAAAKQLNAWPLSIRLEDPKLEAEADSALYTVTPASATLRAPAEVHFEWSDGHLQVSKQLKFGIGYEVELNVSAELDGKPLPVGVAWRGGFGDQSVSSAPALVEVFYSENGKIEYYTYKKLGMKDHQDQPTQVNGFMEAAGIEDTFFTAAFLSNQPGMTLWDWTQQHSITESGKTTQEPVAEMAAGPQTPGPWDVRLYVGPKDLTELGKLNPRLTGLVQFGYMSFLAKPLLLVLKWIYKYVPNYGWDIILLTLAINMALFPLKVKSWHSMKKMQKAMPRIKAIQEKYKKYSMRDPRRKGMQEEMSAIYKEEGANPVGGCLPQLIQMPIWFALYRMLQYSIELRHAPWIGWIHDLSARDPYFILPILMTVAMYYMTKMTPQTVTDPAQQKMMMLMPLAFGIFLFMYSSGLVLYIFTSSMVGIAQQLYLNRNDPLPTNSPFKNKPPKT